MNPCAADPELRIAPLTSDDAVALADVLADDGGYSLRVHGRAPRPADTEAVLTQRPESVAADAKHTLGLFEGDDLVGVADLLDGWPEPGTVHIGLLQLRADHQGRGLARVLHDGARARFLHALSWRLTVVDTNDAVIPFWERLGYRRTGEVRQWQDAEDRTHEAVVMAQPATPGADPAQ